MSTSRARTMMFGALAALLSIVASALVAEVALRAFWSGYYLRAPFRNLEYHPTRGWAPKKSVSVPLGKPEFSTTVTHNSRGFRGPEFEVEKPPNRIRILALGDSMTYGVGVENDETFSAVMQRLDPRLEVINAGVPGYSTAEEYLLFREEGVELSPDIVLIAYLGNDLYGAYRGTFSRFSVKDGVLRVEPPLDPSIEAPILRTKRVRHPTLSRSYLYRFVSDRLKILRYWSYEQLGWATDETIPLDDVEKAWEISFALIREIARLAREIGAEPVIAILPQIMEVQPEVRVVGFDPVQATIQERLLAFAHEEGIPAIDLLPDLRAAYLKTRVDMYHFKDGHWTAAGHAVTAETLVRALEELGLVPPREG